MAKLRVYELAKELGVESKTILTTLRDMGEFVRSASSTIEPLVERRVRHWFREHPPTSRRRPAQITVPRSTTWNTVAADRLTSREPGAVRERPGRPVADLSLDGSVPRARRWRHRGEIPELVGMMLADMGIEGTPFEDEYQAAAQLATEWGRLNCKPSDVRAWWKLGVYGSHAAALFVERGITPELCLARPWHTKRHDPAKDTIINRVMGASPSERHVALRDAVAHLHLSGLLRTSIP